MDVAPRRVLVGGIELVLRRASADDVMALRHAELRPGLPRATAEFDGDGSATTRHFAAVMRDAAAARRESSHEEIVGCLSFMVAPYDGRPAYQLRGMATRRDLVRRGIGRALVEHAVAALVTRDGARLFWCNARLAAVPFYRRVGWQVASGVFEIPTVGPHRVMTFVADVRGHDSTRTIRGMPLE